MSRWKLRDTFAYNFETVLKSVGMIDGEIDEEAQSPKYYRGEGEIDLSTQTLWLNYTVSEPIDTENADNDLFRQQLFIDGQLFTVNGYSDSDFHDLAEAIETQCKSAGIFIKWTGEGRDNSIDTESPIYYVNFEAQQRLLNK